MSPPETIGAAIRAAATRLAETSETPRLDAELLMAEALGVTREAMILAGLGQPIPPFVLSVVEGQAASAAPAARTSTTLSANGSFEVLLERRMSGEPIAYILGHRDFWTIRLKVAPGVLIPRPDSETLIEVAVAHFAGSSGPKRILDLGTGSGALLLAALAEWPEATGVGIDRSPQALAIAQANAEALGMAGRAQIIEGDWSGTGEAFDLILCNPPYIGTAEPLARDVIEHEPHSALFAGADGLDDYRAIAPLLPAQLAPGGVACIEIGATQGAAVASLIASQGLVVQIRHDLAGLDRCIVATRR
ncbi:peptide chain release factor N(5)-glutamine methyltransferase [Sphingomonas oryzagri]|uniref:Release factor glutamine methyltransferase n=1 Tax=Sphingomonas oryzagri TaxID=3042314 RepID=A0ABT6N7E7_9SPHN|nr:peptide chain release factor N(5)-glutamine methyltransferase [Sphingomonas oryzagri]MDH7641036.1 peptide chain release factor N(5)-glutamine methyltransferase [Sphingomonas oryzagri]